MFGQSLLSAFGIACTTDTDQLFQIPTTTSAATYQFNNATTSIPNNTYPGTASNITYATGQFGNAAVFNGSNSYITTNYNVNFSNTAWTISFWMKADIANDRYVLGTDGMSISARGVGSVFLISGGNTAITYSTGVWKHFVYTFDGSGTSKGYGNGILEDTKSSSISSNSNPITFGRYGSNNAGYFDGAIDQVRIFNSELPQAAITVLYNETSATAQSASIDYPSNNPNSIAYYKMSDATDQLGNHNGTATNVNFNTEGKFGFAGAFNGSSSRIILGTSQDFSVTKTGEISFSLWIKTTTSGTGYVFSKGNDATVEYEYFLELLQPSGKLNWRAVNNSDLVAAQVTPNTVVTDGNWHHIVGVIVNNTSVTLYIDGVATTSSSWSGTISYYANNCLIGHGDGIPASGAWFEGDVDQVRIYDSALSAADVTKLYKEVECEPAAINALDHFNTVLYTGAGTTNTITGVGFQPDFVWIKDRDAALNNLLADTVRGISTDSSNTTSLLISNLTLAELTNRSEIRNLSNDGFDVTGTSSGSNTTNNDYVAWNWKAPLANLSTSFNGSSSKIEVTNSGNVFEAVGGFSASVWVNRNTTANQTILNKEGGVSGSYGWSLRYTSGAGYSYDLYDTSNNMVTVSTGANSTTATWEHVAISFNNSDNKLRIYYNGGPAVVSSALSSAASSNTENFFIGARTNSGIVTDGDLAQVRIYSTAVTDTQVSDLYAEPAASNNTLNYPTGAGCIAAYPLQTDAVDLSGNYNGASSNVTFGQPGYLTGNTDGTITSTVAANPEAGFSIVKYTGNGAASATVGHGLAVQPRLVIVKRLLGGYNWMVGYLNNSNSQHSLYLNTTDAKDNELNRSPQAFNTTTFQLGSIANAHTNGSTNEYIAYCFTSIPGYSKIGSYIGNDTTNTIYVGFKPRFLLIKCSSNGGTNKDWVIIDSTMDPSTPITKRLEANTSDAEATDTINITMNNNGWTMPNGTSTASINQIGFSYIFLAIA